MSEQPPDLITIDCDDYSARHVGHTADGRQFFLTSPFIPAQAKDPGREFLALYIFDVFGRFMEARIDDLGARTGLDRDAARRLVDERLRQLGQITFGRIEVRPFQIERFSTEFGLIARPPEEEGDGWWVEAQPGNYMAFHEPWDSGEYDT